MFTYNKFVGKDVDWRDPSAEFIVVENFDFDKITFCNTELGPIGLIEEAEGYWHGQQGDRESWITVLFNLATGEYTIEDSYPWNTYADLADFTYDDVECTIREMQQKYGTTWNSLKFHNELMVA